MPPLSWCTRFAADVQTAADHPTRPPRCAFVIRHREARPCRLFIYTHEPARLTSIFM